MPDHQLPSLETALGRRISIGAAYDLLVEPLEHAAQHALELHIPEELFGASDCQPFEYTTLPVLVPLEPAQCVHLIDPARWSEFSDITVTNVKKTLERPSGGWVGTMDETVWVKFGPIQQEYINTLNIDYDVTPTGAVVKFTLAKALKGGLASEVGSMRLEQVAGSLFMTIDKTLQYTPPNDWCRLPVPALVGILGIWLQAAAHKYVLGMVAAQPQP